MALGHVDADGENNGDDSDGYVDDNGDAKMMLLKIDIKRVVVAATIEG